MFRGGFEPPTQGFSVLCSTPELSKQTIKLNLIKFYDDKSILLSQYYRI